jgi:hypothetical protein
LIQFFSFFLSWGWGQGVLVFFPCSQCIPIKFPKCSKCVPQDVTNNTWVLSHMVCPSSTPVYINWKGKI